MVWNGNATAIHGELRTPSLAFHLSRNFLSGDIAPVFLMSWMAIVGKAGSDPAAFSFMLFPSRLSTAGAVLVRFILTPVGRRIREDIVEGEHLTADTLVLSTE
jgi:hypothetical protein